MMQILSITYIYRAIMEYKLILLLEHRIDMQRCSGLKHPAPSKNSREENSLVGLDIMCRLKPVCTNFFARSLESKGEEYGGRVETTICT
uniref:Uncharacterized protein n=1 Tax=Romanomermis culicivorax TaxID=13658 RepID=A0A915K0W8_ROMCU